MLISREAAQLGEVVDFARRQAAGMRTEFLGESRIALRRVVDNAGGVLNDQEIADVRNVLEQLNQAFDKSND